MNHKKDPKISKIEKFHQGNRLWGTKYVYPNNDESICEAICVLFL